MKKILAALFAAAIIGTAALALPGTVDARGGLVDHVA